jgi:hypothetical protein
LGRKTYFGESFASSSSEGSAEKPWRSLLRKHKTMDGYVHGRFAKHATALFDKPTDGGKDNLHNFLQAETRDKSYTTAELKELIAGRFPNRNIETQYKRATDKNSNMMEWHRSDKRWRWRFDSAPKLEDLEICTDDGSKYAERLNLYGYMPRCKHKPGDVFLAEASEVLRYMSRQSGETDLEKLQAEYNRIPKAWIDSVKEQKDSDRDIARANLIHDRGTGETIGPLTYRDEMKSKQSEDVCDDASTVKEVEDPEEDEEASTEWIQEGFDYLVEGPDEDEFAIGQPGRRKLLDPDAISRIESMPKLRPKDAREWITDILKEHCVRSVQIESFIKNAVERGVIVQYVFGEEIEGSKHKSDRDKREKYGWPEKLPGDLDVKLVFQGMTPSSSKEPFLQRAEQFVDMYRWQLDPEVTAKAIANHAFKLGVIVLIKDVWQIAA